MGRNQQKIIELLEKSPDIKLDKKGRFPWLKNKPLPEYFGKYYDTAMEIFFSLEGHEQGLAKKRCLPLPFPDAYLLPPYDCLFEFDEIQHFTKYRLKALNLYPREMPYGFNIEEYKELCRRFHQEAIAKGAEGYRARKNEFPFPNGRAAQRAFFDMFKDFLPVVHGLNPTVRVTEFEVEDILKNQISKVDSIKKLVHIIKSRLGIQ